MSRAFASSPHSCRAPAHCLEFPVASAAWVLSLRGFAGEPFAARVRLKCAQPLSAARLSPHSLFWSQEMEIAICGLQNAGKSTYVQVLNTGEYQENLIPTVGFNMHKVQKNRCTIKVWDLGGQQQFRSTWKRYCRNVNAIVFVVDSADKGKLDEARQELKNLFDSSDNNRTPLLVLFNKNDLKDALKPEALVKALDLDAHRRVRVTAFHSISCKTCTNIDKTMDWLIKQGKN